MDGKSIPPSISLLKFRGGAESFINKWYKATYYLQDLVQQYNYFMEKMIFKDRIHYIYYTLIIYGLTIMYTPTNLEKVNK